MTRSLGLLAIVAPFFAIAWLLLPGSEAMPLWLAGIAVAAAWTLGTLALTGRFDHLDPRSRAVIHAGAPLLVLPFLAWADDRAALGFALLLVWSTPYAFCLFPLGFAIAEATAAGGCFLVARLLSPSSDPSLALLALETAVVIATIVAVGLFARAVLRSAREEERTRIHRERVLAELGRASLDAPQLETVVEAALDNARAELGADLAAFAELDAAGDLRLASTTGVRTWPAGTVVPAGRSTLLGRALIEDAVVSDDILADERVDALDTTAELGLRAAIAVAVHAHGGERTGVLGVYSRRRGAFSPDDVAFLQSLSHLVASARAHFDAEERLRHRALHDPLTGLPNRTLLGDRLRQALARGRRDRDRRVALILLDLDRFKQVNDSLGHAVGDRLLVAAAQRLAGAIRESDTLARMGGDEFVVIAEGVEDSSHALEIAGRVVAALDEPLEVGARRLHMRASAGVALAGPDTTPDELLAHADAAMYQCKAEGQGGVDLYDDELRVQGTMRLRVEQSLHRALREDELRVHFQPIVDPATRAPRSLEALVRWYHPRRGIVRPGDFIPTAESTGLIVPIGERILRLALEELARWRATPGLGDLTVSVNVSTHQLRAAGFVGKVCDLLQAAGLPPQALTLEVTEHVLLDPDGPAVAAAIALDRVGVGIALDDFGTGSSSLSSLRILPVRTVKIDRSFIAGVGVDEADTAVVRGVLAMAHGAGVGVVAEGVETAAQAAAIVMLGCDGAQGYFYARPAPPEDVAELLRSASAPPPVSPPGRAPAMETEPPGRASPPPPGRTPAR